MAKRGRKPRALNEQRQAVIDEEYLKENPVDHPDELDEPLVIAQEIPEMRTIVFVNGRDPGGPLEFHYHSKTHYLKQYKLLHGHEYTLPVEVIDHIESLCVPNYAHRKGIDGHPEPFIASYTYLYQCRNAKNSPSHRAA